VRLRHRFISAEWDSVAGEYTIVCRNEVTGDEVVTRAKVLVSAIGGFHTPLIPKLKNRDIYTGKVVHTARWPKELKVEDLRGKKVAVIGNGCSG
jgi:4-hydroxyacetophenone monooxygenase